MAHDTQRREDARQQGAGTPTEQQVPRGRGREAMRTQLRAASWTGGQRMLRPRAEDRVDRQAAAPASEVPALAAQGVGGGGGPLPHLDLIQASFGHHDVSGVRTHTGPAAAAAAAAIGAEAYAVGGDVAFGRTPSLHTAAHEAAHVIQQRGGVHLRGGVGEVGDQHEEHADRVADHVVRGESAEALLDQYAHASGGGAGRQVQCRHLDLTHFGEGLATLTDDHRGQADELRQSLIEEAGAAGDPTQWPTAIEQLVGYASPEGRPAANQTLSEDRSRAVAAYLFEGERDIDPESWVEGVGEVHEGQDCSEEDYPLWRKVRLDLREPLVETAEPPAPEAEADPTPVEETDSPLLDAVDTGELLGQDTIGEILAGEAFTAVRDEALTQLVLTRLLGEALANALGYLTIIFEIIAAAPDAFASAVPRRNAQGMGYAYGFVWELDGRDVAGLPATSPIADTIYDDDPTGAVCAVHTPFGWMVTPNGAPSYIPVDAFINRYSGHWQLGIQNGSFGARRLRDQPFDPSALWDSLSEAQRADMPRAAFDAALSGCSTMFDLMTTLMAAASDADKQRLLNAIGDRQLANRYATWTYPLPTPQTDAALCGDAPLAPEAIDTETDEAAYERRAEQRRQREERQQRDAAEMEQNLGLGQETPIGGSGNTVVQ